MNEFDRAMARFNKKLERISKRPRVVERPPQRAAALLLDYAKICENAFEGCEGVSGFEQAMADAAECRRLADRFGGMLAT